MQRSSQQRRTPTIDLRRRLDSRSQGIGSLDSQDYAVVTCRVCNVEFRVRADRTSSSIRCPHCQAIDCVSPPKSTEPIPDPQVAHNRAKKATSPKPRKRRRNDKRPEKPVSPVSVDAVSVDAVSVDAVSVDAVSVDAVPLEQVDEIVEDAVAPRVDAAASTEIAAAPVTAEMVGNSAATVESLRPTLDATPATLPTAEPLSDSEETSDPVVTPGETSSRWAELDRQCTIEDIRLMRDKYASEESDSQEELCDDPVGRRLAASRDSLNRWLIASEEDRTSSFRLFEADERRRLRCDERRIAFDRASVSKIATQAYRNRLRVPLAKFCLTPVPMPSDRFQVPTVIGIANPYRIADCLPSAPDKTLQGALGQFGRTRGPNAVGVGLGFETLFTPNAILQFLRQNKPLRARSRIAHELFWFHLSDDWSVIFREVGNVAGYLTLALLREFEATCAIQHAALVRHAIAVSWLNAALTREMAFVLGRTATAVGYWDVALECWCDTIDDALFWDAFRSRVEACGRTAEYADALRDELPLYLICLVSRFAQAYGRVGDDVSFHRLTATLHRSRLPSDVVDTVVSAMVRSSYY